MFRKPLILGVIILSLFILYKYFLQRQQEFIHLKKKTLRKEITEYPDDIPEDTRQYKRRNITKRYTNEFKAEYFKYLYLHPDEDISIDEFASIRRDISRQHGKVSNFTKAIKLKTVQLNFNVIFKGVKCESNDELWVLVYDSIEKGFPAYNGEFAPYIASKRVACTEGAGQISFVLNNLDNKLSVFAYLIRNGNIVAIGKPKYNSIPISHLLEYRGSSSLDIELKPSVYTKTLINFNVANIKDKDMELFSIKTASYLADVNYFNSATIRVDNVARFRSFPIFSDLLFGVSNNLFLVYGDLPHLEPSKLFVKGLTNVLYTPKLSNFTKPRIYVPSISKVFDLQSTTVNLSLKDAKEIFIELFDADKLFAIHQVPVIKGYVLHYPIFPISISNLSVSLEYEGKPLTSLVPGIRYNDSKFILKDNKYIFSDLRFLSPYVYIYFSIDKLDYNVLYRLKPVKHSINLDLITKGRFLSISRKYPTYAGQSFLYAKNVDKMLSVSLSDNKLRVSYEENSVINFGGKSGVFINNLKPDYYLIYLYKNNTLFSSRFVKLFSGINIIAD